MSSGTTPSNPERAQFSQEIGALSMKPLWERAIRLKPGTAAIPAIWRWDDVLPLSSYAPQN
jgi:gentisate 1,2-dioxygenase